MPEMLSYYLAGELMDSKMPDCALSEEEKFITDCNVTSFSRSDIRKKINATADPNNTL